MFVQVYEFLEDISSSLTDLATKELKMLKDLKVKSLYFALCILMYLFSFVSHSFGSYATSEERGRRGSIWD